MLAFLLVLCASPVVAWSHRHRELLETQYNSKGGILVFNYSATPHFRTVPIDTLPLLAMECEPNGIMSMRLSADVSPKEPHEDDPFVFGKSRLFEGMILVGNGGCGEKSRPFYRHITSITRKPLNARSILYTMETEEVPLWYMFAHADMEVTYLPLSHPEHPGVSALPSHIRRLVDDDYVETEIERILREVGDYKPFIDIDYDSELFGYGWNHELGAGSVAKDPKLAVYQAEYFKLSCVECFAYVEVKTTFKLKAALRSVSFNGGWWNLIPGVAVWNALTWAAERIANMIPRLELFEVSMEGKAEIKIILEAEMEKSYTYDPHYTYEVVGIPDITFAIGIIPVYIETTLDVTVGAKISVDQGAKAYAGFGAQAALDVGFRAFRARDGNLVSSKWFRPALTLGIYGPGFKITKASIAPYVRFRTTFSLYGVAPVSFALVPSVTFQLSEAGCDGGTELTQRFKLMTEISVHELTIGINLFGQQWQKKFGSPLLPKMWQIPLIGETDIVPPKCINLPEYPSDFQNIEYSHSWSLEVGHQDGPYVYLGYGLCTPLGIRVFNGDGDNEGSIQQKTDNCAAACLLKETALAYGPWSDKPDAIGFGLNEVSGRCYCQHVEWAPCTKKHASYKVYKFEDFTEAPSYVHYPRSCVSGSNIELFSDQDLDECALRCDDMEACVGFEYGVDYGQNTYDARDCILQSSTNRASDCTNFNLDFYEKVEGTEQPDAWPSECLRELNVDQTFGSGWRRIQAPRAVTDIDCARACNNNEKCKAWINVHYSSSCYLSETIPTKFKAANRRSYGTRCPSLGSRTARQGVSVVVPTTCSECNAGLGSDQFWCASAPGAETGSCLSVGSANFASCPPEQTMVGTCTYIPPVEIMTLLSLTEADYQDGLILTSIRWTGGPNGKITVFTTDLEKGGLYSDFFGVQMMNENDGKADIVVYQDILEEDTNGVLRRPRTKELVITVASAETASELQITARRPPNFAAPFWRAAPWSLCSSPCGGGVTTRDMDCYQAADPADPESAYVQVSDALCPQPAFIAEYPCNLNPCDRSDLILQVQPDKEDYSSNPYKTVRSLAGESVMIFVAGGEPGAGYTVEYAWMGETYPFDQTRETAVWNPIYNYEMSQGTNLSRVLNIQVPFDLPPGFYDARVGSTGDEEVDDFTYGDRLTYVPPDTGCQLRCGPGLQYTGGQCTLDSGSPCCTSTEAACGEAPESRSDTARCVCAFDSFCCSNAWDSQCKKEAVTACNLVCLQ